MAKIAYMNQTIAQVVSMLEDLLHRARNGEVEYTCAYAISKDDIITMRGGEITGIDALTLIGHLEREKVFLMAQVSHIEEEPRLSDDERDR